MEHIESYISKGWKLSEFSNWLSYQEKENFFTLLGTENFILLDQVESKPHKKWKAKLLISPVGLEKLTLFYMPVAGSA
jgi:hypothetical protein